MFKRCVIAVLNILFPPLAVALLTGAGPDLIMNCLLFLLAVIPSHIHGFYISLTYFNRKRRVRKGKYPGDRRPGIYSERVQWGGASRREYLRLKEEKAWRENGGVGIREKSLSRRTSTRRANAGYSPVADKIEGWDDGNSATSSRSSRRVTPSNSIGRGRRYASAVEDYEYGGRDAVQQSSRRRSSRSRSRRGY